MASDEGEVLQIEFSADVGGALKAVHTIHGIVEEMLQTKDQAMSLLFEQAQAVTQQPVKRLTYQDSDGDWCTLNKTSLEDALSFSERTEEGVSLLRVSIVTEKGERQPAVAPSPPGFAPPPRAAEEEEEAVPEGCPDACVPSEDQQPKLWQSGLGCGTLPFKYKYTGKEFSAVGWFETSNGSSFTWVSVNGNPHDSATWTPRNTWPDLSLEGRLMTGSHTCELERNEDGYVTTLTWAGSYVWTYFAESSTTEVVEAKAADGDDGLSLDAACGLVQEELNTLGHRADLRCIIPKLAGMALMIIEEVQEPSLFPLIEIFAAFVENNLDPAHLPMVLPQMVAAVMELPKTALARVLQLARREAARIVKEVHQSKAEGAKDVEVHPNFTCDGCEANPIIGKRYRSLDMDDYDLCETCYDKANKDGQRWKRVKANVFGRVESSFFAPPEDVRAGHLVHGGVQCDGCDMYPIIGRRFRSLDRSDYDLCEHCREVAPDKDRYEEVQLHPGCKDTASLIVNGNAADALAVAEAGQDQDCPEELDVEQPCEDEHACEDEEEELRSRMELEDAAAALETMGHDAMKVMLIGLLQHPDQAVRSAIVVATRDVEEKSEEVVAPALIDDQVAPDPVVVPSAQIVMSEPLVLGVEAEEDEQARGDVTSELGQLLAESGARQVYRIGRVTVPVQTEVPASATFLVANNGDAPWPTSTALTAVAGDSCGFADLPLGPLAPGEVAQVVMDLMLPCKEAPEGSRSAWAIVDKASGTLLGPMLCLETIWVAR